MRYKKHDPKALREASKNLLLMARTRKENARWCDEAGFKHRADRDRALEKLYREMAAELLAAARCAKQGRTFRSIEEVDRAYGWKPAEPKRQRKVKK